MAAAERAGAQVVKALHDTFYGGYAGYFRDPDGHLWEIVWNPDLLPPEKHRSLRTHALSLVATLRHP